MIGQGGSNDADFLARYGSDYFQKIIHKVDLREWRC